MTSPEPATIENDVRPGAHAGAVVHPVLASLASFQAWIVELKAAGDARMAATDLVELRPRALSGFCFGAVGGSCFFGAESRHLSWLASLPMIHAAVRRDGKTVSLVTEATEIMGAAVPCFAIRIEATRVEVTSRLLKQKFLPVHEAWAGADGEIDRICHDPCRTIDIQIVDEDASIAALLSGKNPWGFRGRSVIKAKG